MAAAPLEPEGIDQYIAARPPKARAVLRKLRSTIKRVAPPETEEIISYRIPAFRLHGILIYFAAFKNHVGVFPPVRGDAKLEAAVAKYAGPKGNLKFPLDAPIPYALVARIVKFRVKLNLAKARKK
ncbi:MAG TPA: DUF1801 domain-containing protein [Steroidobacteraceae bacterium]